jgi:hypothetical protein
VTKAEGGGHGAREFVRQVTSSCHRVTIFFVVEHSACIEEDSSKIIFVVNPSGSVPKGTTTKLIFIMMGAQTGMTILPE